MSEQYEYAMDMLFTAKWNIPKAAEYMGMVAKESSWSKVKLQFKDYCRRRPPSWGRDPIK